MWFTKIAGATEPGLAELHGFLDEMQQFLGFVLKQTEDFGFLWDDDPELLGLAWDTFEADVSREVKRLHESLSSERAQENVREHGLVGRPMRFKLRSLASIARKWGRKAAGRFSIRAWLRRMFEAIDTILDSLIQAAGVGGLVKEFKDTLMALAGEA